MQYAVPTATPGETPIPFRMHQIVAMRSVRQRTNGTRAARRQLLAAIEFAVPLARRSVAQRSRGKPGEMRATLSVVAN